MPSRSRFLPLMISQQSDSNTSLQLTMNTACQQIFKSAKRQISIVSSVGLSDAFFTTSRRILLGQAQFERCDNTIQCLNEPMQIFMYNQIELALTKDSQPIEFVYLQTCLKQSESHNTTATLSSSNFDIRIIQINFIISSYVLFEITNEQHIHIFINHLENFINTMNKFDKKVTLPNILLLTNDKLISEQTILTIIQSELNKHNIDLLHLQNIKLSSLINQPQLNQNEDNINQLRQLSLIGKQIITNLRYFTIANTIVPINCLINLLNSLINNQNNDNTLPHLWNQIYQTQLNNLLINSLQQYQHLFKQLTFGKTIITEQSLQQAHKLAKKSTIKIVSQRLIKHIDDINTQTQSQLQNYQSHMDDIKLTYSHRNHKNIFNWGKQFLQSNYDTIINKIHKEQIKSINAFKQQIILLHEQFIKKTQMIITLQLAQYYASIVVEKILECLTVLNGKLANNVAQNNKIQLERIMVLDNENWEMRKQMTKDQMIFRKEHCQLKEDNIQLNSKNDLLSRTIERLKVQNDQLQGQYEQHIAQSTSQQYALRQQLQKFQQQHQETISKLHKQTIFLKSQITKQHLLHQQSHQNYKQLLQMYRDKQLLLKDQIEQLSVHSELQLSEMKQSSVREMSGYQEIQDKTVDEICLLKEQIEKYQITIREQEIQIGQLNVSWAAKLQAEKDQRREIQVKLKVLQDKCLDYEQRDSTYRKQLYKPVIKLTKLVNQHQDIYLSKQFQSEKLSNQQHSQHQQQQLSAELLHLPNNISKLYANKILNKPITIDSSLQVDDTQTHTKLKQALQIIKYLQHNYTISHIHPKSL